MAYSFGYRVAYAKYGEKLLDFIDFEFLEKDLVEALERLERVKRLLEKRNEVLWITTDDRRLPRDYSDEEVMQKVLEEVKAVLPKIDKACDFISKAKWKALD